MVYWICPKLLTVFPFTWLWYFQNFLILSAWIKTSLLISPSVDIWICIWQYLLLIVFVKLNQNDNKYWDSNAVFVAHTAWEAQGREGQSQQAQNDLYSPVVTEYIRLCQSLMIFQKSSETYILRNKFLARVLMNLSSGRSSLTIILKIVQSELHNYPWMHD